MLINSKNYFDYVDKIGVSKLSPPIKKMHDLISRITNNGSNWKDYQTYKSQMDKQFEAVTLFWNDLKKNETPAKIHSKPIKQHLHSLLLKKEKVSKSAPIEKSKGKEVELVSPEVTFIKRFALLHNKEKNRQQVLSFIKAIQKAIVERKIRKDSKLANVITFIQKQLVSTYNSMGESIAFNFSNEDNIKYLKMAGAEHLMPSVQFIKSYISMLGQTITKEKAGRLLERIFTAIDKKHISSTDKYRKHIDTIIASLDKFIKTGNSPNVSEAQLNGLEGILKSCGCHHTKENRYKESNSGSLSGIEDEEIETLPKNAILNSKQVVNLKENKLNFTGKWLNFIGNPSKGFTAMIYGKPKFGKSYLAIDLAGYLARNHGKVLYVAREEGFDDTMQQKLKDKNVSHDNLFVSDYLPNNLSSYNFVFFDSVNKLGLSAQELEKLERKYPETSFVYIFQTTKDGDFKGAMEFKHNVDAVIEVPQRGIASQYGRYNQGGEMKIFE